MTENNFTANIISSILAERHSGQGWAYFKEFMPMTGYAATLNSIDGIAVGLWQKTFGIFAYEIKISRGDFLNDVRQFHKKHEHALNISHYFYYVCPWGLIEKSEVPEIAGLMYVNKSNGIKIVKQATLREVDCIDIPYFQGFAKVFGNKIDNAKAPIQLLGKDITQEELVKLIQEEAKRKQGFEFDRKVKESVARVTENTKEERQFIAGLKHICGVYSYHDDKDGPQKGWERIRNYCRLGVEADGNEKLKNGINALKVTVEELDRIMEGIEKEE